jgi:uncharacterized protein YjbJ (UPF0337 family)
MWPDERTRGPAVASILSTTLPLDRVARRGCRSRSAWPLYQPIIEELTMNKDQVKGKAKDVGGKIQEEAGKLVGSKSQQVKGLQHQAEGKVQKGVGDVKEAVKDLKAS